MCNRFYSDNARNNMAHVRTELCFDSDKNTIFFVISFSTCSIVWAVYLFFLIIKLSGPQTISSYNFMLYGLFPILCSVAVLAFYAYRKKFHQRRFVIMNERHNYMNISTSIPSYNPNYGYLQAQQAYPQAYNNSSNKDAVLSV